MIHSILLMVERERIVLIMNGVHCLTTEENMKRKKRFHDDFEILYNQYSSINECFCIYPFPTVHYELFF
jgi:hypothetical protein